MEIIQHLMYNDKKYDLSKFSMLFKEIQRLRKQGLYRWNTLYIHEFEEKNGEK